MMQTATTAQDRIHAAALAAGWVTRTGETPAGAGVVEYQRGSKRVWVYYGVRGTVIQASYQQGSTGGRNILGAGKEARVIEALTATRWTH